MPYRRALKIHFLAVAERITALGAARARRMEMVVVACLKDFSADVAFTVGAFDAEGLLVILFTIRLAVLAHVFAAQHSTAHQTSKKRNENRWDTNR